MAASPHSSADVRLLLVSQCIYMYILIIHSVTVQAFAWVLSV